MQPLQTENVCYNNVHKISGGVAQLGERTVRIRKVESSILFVSTIMRRYELFFIVRNVFALTIKIADR